MFFCASLAIALVKSGRVAAPAMDRETYMRAIVPIGGFYALTLWVGNAAYLYLSVSFIQMLKASAAGQLGGGVPGACQGLQARGRHARAVPLPAASGRAPPPSPAAPRAQALMPVAVFSVGCAFGTERFNWTTMANMLLVTLGVAVASYGAAAPCSALLAAPGCADRRSRLLTAGAEGAAAPAACATAPPAPAPSLPRRRAQLPPCWCAVPAGQHHQRERAAGHGADPAAGALPPAGACRALPPTPAADAGGGAGGGHGPCLHTGTC